MRCLPWPGKVPAADAPAPSTGNASDAGATTAQRKKKHTVDESGLDKATTVNVFGSGGAVAAGAPAAPNPFAALTSAATSAAPSNPFAAMTAASPSAPSSPDKPKAGTADNPFANGGGPMPKVSNPFAAVSSGSGDNAASSTKAAANPFAELKPANSNPFAAPSNKASTAAAGSGAGSRGDSGRRADTNARATKRARRPSQSSGAANASAGDSPLRYKYAKRMARLNRHFHEYVQVQFKDNPCEDWTLGLKVRGLAVAVPVPAAAGVAVAVVVAGVRALLACECLTHAWLATGLLAVCEGNRRLVRIQVRGLHHPH